MEKKNKGGGLFSGQLGFVLAAAGSAVGVGNIWRFPYFAAQDGGGLFLILYVGLVFTFGITLLSSDLAMGRKTESSSVKAYAKAKKGWGFLGKLTFLVPAFIMTYYAIIGGWILKYLISAFTQAGRVEEASDGYFVSFITSDIPPIVYALIFMGLTALIVFLGVENGIEKLSKYLMPILLVMIVGISIFALTLTYTDSNGVTRTGIQGLGAYLTPNMDGLTPKRFLQILLDAMSQMFFSLSVSMGIMITYGSYVKKDVNMTKSVFQVAGFDTIVALLAGCMIIPPIFVFSGMEGMAGGPSLVFVALPKVFNAMGPAGGIISIIFFTMFAFAALTSCISVLETLVANCMEIFKASRKKVTTILTIIYSAATIIVCLGYTKLFFELPLPNGSVGQLLDLMDYISNSFLMPLISLLSSILIGWVLKPQWIIEEMESSGHKFTIKGLFSIMIRYVAPVVMFILFLQSIGVFNFLN